MSQRNATLASRLDAETAWAWALAAYARPEAAAASLALQEAADADVVLALLALHLAELGWALDADGWRAVEMAVSPWRAAVILPHRALRARLRGGVTGVASEIVAAHRADLARLEVAAERVAHDLAVAAARPRLIVAPPDARAEAVETYLAACRPGRPTVSDRERIFMLVEATAGPISKERRD